MPILRRCNTCGETKELTEFPRDRHRTKLGRQHRCKACSAKKTAEWRKKNPDKHRQQVLDWRRQNPHKVAEYARNHRRANPELTADRAAKTNYGLPIGHYQFMFMAQGGKCAICFRDEIGRKNTNRFAIDHCADTKRIRGLLCHKCNLGIGYFNHDPNLLTAAINYLNRTSN